MGQGNAAHSLASISIVVASTLFACTSTSEEDATAWSADAVRKNRCGNGVCSHGETCSSCPQDCGACPTEPPPPPPPDAGTITSPGGGGVVTDPSLYGPQASIGCAVGSVNIAPGQDIPSIVDSSAPGTSFCILAGVHTPTRPINPKPNQKLVGQYGAIIDGANVTMSYDIGSTSIIRGWNCGSDCSGVTVQNLVLRNLKAYSCIGLFSDYANNWTIDHNEVHGCQNGVAAGRQSGARVTNNYIHHNIGNVSSSVPAERGFGFGGYQTRDTVFESNHVAFNGTEQKWCATSNVTTRRNWVHENAGDGIWYDGDNVGALIEDNLVEDQPREGIFYEISGPGIIRNNTVRRSGTSGIFISTSRDVEIYGNVLEGNYRGINLFVNCAAVGTPYPGSIGFDLRNINAHHNNIVVSTERFTQYVIASGMSYTACTAAQFAAYTSGTKNLVLQSNAYSVPSLTGPWWYWDGWKTWDQWRAVPQDVSGTVTTGTLTPPSPPSSGPDTTAPTVAISTPPESSTVSGTVTITASAWDSVGLVGVQFKIDGANLGSEDAVAPYSASWNTTAYANGAHTMTAVARDAAGNTATTPGLVVYVNN